jgi:hypothetical protein
MPSDGISYFVWWRWSNLVGKVTSKLVAVMLSWRKWMESHTDLRVASWTEHIANVFLLGETICAIISVASRALQVKGLITWTRIWDKELDKIHWCGALSFIWANLRPSWTVFSQCTVPISVSVALFSSRLMVSSLIYLLSVVRTHCVNILTTRF